MRNQCVLCICHFRFPQPNRENFVKISIVSRPLRDGGVYTLHSLVLDGQPILQQISVIGAIDVEWALHARGLGSNTLASALAQLGMTRSPLATKIQTAPPRAVPARRVRPPVIESDEEEIDTAPLHALLRFGFIF
jgi:hypothetical protein